MSAYWPVCIECLIGRRLAGRRPSGQPGPHILHALGRRAQRSLSGSGLHRLFDRLRRLLELAIGRLASRHRTRGLAQRGRAAGVGAPDIRGALQGLRERLALGVRK